MSYNNINLQEYVPVGERSKGKRKGSDVRDLREPSFTGQHTNMREALGSIQQAAATILEESRRFREAWERRQIHFESVGAHAGLRESLARVGGALRPEDEPGLGPDATTAQRMQEAFGRLFSGSDYSDPARAAAEAVRGRETFELIDTPLTEREIKAIEEAARLESEVEERAEAQLQDAFARIYQHDPRGSVLANHAVRGRGW